MTDLKTDLKTDIKQHLQAFHSTSGREAGLPMAGRQRSEVERQPLELRPAALTLLDTLGYASEKTMELDGSPAAFLDQFNQHPEATRFSEEKALVSDWQEIQLLFQLTDQELGGQVDLFDESAVSQSLMQSYLFFAVKLGGEGYARGKLADITRQLNRLFPMPVMVLFVYDEKLSMPHQISHENGANKLASLFSPFGLGAGRVFCGF